MQPWPQPGRINRCMLSRTCAAVVIGLSVTAIRLPAADADALLHEADAAEGRLDTRHALELCLEANAARPNDARILQKIARQYSDLLVDVAGNEEKQRCARLALEYSEQAVRLDPKDPVNVLSLAVCHGELAVFSDVETKVKYSRYVKEEAERALALNPNYAWAHHVLGRWHYEVATLGVTARIFTRLLYGGLPGASCAEAISHLQQAVALEPGQLEHRLELGFAYLADGRKDLARVQFEAGLGMPSREKHDEPAKARARAALEQLGR